MHDCPSSGLHELWNDLISTHSPCTQKMFLFFLLQGNKRTWCIVHDGKKNILYAIMRFVVIRVNTSKGKKKTMRKKIICWIMCNQKFKIVRSCNGCRFEFRNVSPPGSEFGNCYQVECPRGDCYLSLAGGWVWRQSSGGSSLDGPRQSARLDVCKSRSPFSQDWRVLFTILTVQVCISFIQRISN